MGLQSFVFNLILAFMHQSRRGEKKIRPNASAYVLRVQKPKNAKRSCFSPRRKDISIVLRIRTKVTMNAQINVSFRQSRTTSNSTGIAASTLVYKMLPLCSRAMYVSFPSDRLSRNFQVHG
jgi:hypothetical protein